MIIDDITNLSKYAKVFGYLQTIQNFISDKNSDIASLKSKTEITPGIFVTVENAVPKPVEEQKLETHAKFIDLHYIIDGFDIVGWKSSFECKDVYKKYDESKDIAFFNDPCDFSIKLVRGKFAVFFPEDAHAPLCGDKPLKKCIFKIRAEILKK